MSESICLQTRKNNKKFMVLSAIGIIMVVDAHSWTILDLFSSVIPYNSFFMPMFFFISGYFNKVGADTDIKAYITKKLRKLLLPYAVFSLFLLVMEYIIDLIICGSVPSDLYDKVVISLWSVILGVPDSISSPLWFLYILFLVQIIYALLRKLLCKKWNSIVMLMIFCLFNIYSVYCAKKIEYNALMTIFLKCMFFMPFMELGVIYREKIESKMERLKTGGNVILLLALLLLNTFRLMILPYPDSISFIDLEYMIGFTSPYVVTPLISSVIGILFWLTIVDTLGGAVYDNKLINYISANTLWILSLHVFFFNILNCILLFIHKQIIPLQGFTYSSASWYLWYPFNQFRVLYFSFGIIGPLLVKFMYDKVKMFFGKALPK